MQNLMRKQNKIPNNYKISIVTGVNIYMTRLKFVTMVMKNATHNLFAPLTKRKLDNHGDKIFHV